MKNSETEAISCRIAKEIQLVDSNEEMRKALASYQAQLQRFQAEQAEIENREHKSFEDASRVIRLRDEITELSTQIFHTREHIARDPG